MSNYPPGVTGWEWQISGPSTETETRMYCAECGQEQDGMLRTWSGYDPDWTCDVCDAQVEIIQEDW